MFDREHEIAYAPPPLAQVGDEMLEEQRREAGFWSGEQQNMVALIREFCHDPAVADKFEEFKNFLIFGMTSRHVVLGNFDKDDIKIMVRKFYIIRDKFLNSLRQSQLTDHMQMKLDNLEMVFRAILTRASGSQRERILESSQIRQTVLTRDMEPPKKKSGFFGRMLGFGRK